MSHVSAYAPRARPSSRFSAVLHESELSGLEVGSPPVSAVVDGRCALTDLGGCPRCDDVQAVALQVVLQPSGRVEACARRHLDTEQRHPRQSTGLRPETGADVLVVVQARLRCQIRSLLNAYRQKLDRRSSRAVERAGSIQQAVVETIGEACRAPEYHIRRISQSVGTCPWRC